MKDRRKKTRGSPTEPSNIDAEPLQEVSTPAGLHRLIYTSEAKAPGEMRTGVNTAIEEIAAPASRKNKSRDLTGALIAVRGHFIQILEGEPADLENVFEHICRDMRHRAISLVDFSPAKERVFSKWRMVPIDSDNFEDPELLEDLFMGILGGMAPDAIVREIDSVVSQHAERLPQAS